MGTNSNIMVILKETSFGHFYFSIANLLRETILLNSMLLNVEVWFGITKEEIAKLEMVDKILLRRFLETPRSTPVSSLYLEMGSVPVSFIIKSPTQIYFSQ